VARTGGDEFSIILEEPVTRQQAEAVGNTLLQLLNEPIQLNGGNVARIGASVGVAIFPEDAHDPESLFIAADQRMYSSKRDPQNPAKGELPVAPVGSTLSEIRSLPDPALPVVD
jgi:diguanylate cyclase (GGDEF)-like protein